MNQTNPFFCTLKSLCSPFILSYFLFFSLLTRITLCSVNPNFEACQPKTCGNGQNISYPFYIENKQEPFCGFPGFGLSCENGFPRLNLSHTFYIVQQIFYTNQSLRVSNPAFSNFNSSNCFSPPHNLTLYGNKFNFARNQKELFLFFNCTVLEGVEEYRIGCSAPNKTSSVLAMDNEDEKLKHAWKNCTGGMVRTMVEEGYRGGGEGIGEALRRGFVLNWTVTDCSQCEMSGGKCGFDTTTYGFRCFCRDGDHLLKCNSGNKSKALKLGLGLGLGLGIGFPGFLIIGIVLWCYKRKYAHSDFRFQSRNAPHSNSDLEGSNVYYGVPVFSYRELEAATHSFDHTRELGDGGFGTVYYGKLRDGREVAVKRLYEQNYRRVQQFMNEVKILTRLRHRNLVSLYGCTSRHSRELLLVYDYIPNGTVAYHLHLHADSTKPNLLPWSTRMKIAIETASALAYLHASDIIHRDVKTNNILLDNSFCVKVADFGLSRLFPNNVTHVSTAPQGTPGYVDPEYHHYYQLTSKSDVYSFGVVLIELISSMAAVDMSRDRDDINLSSLAIRKIQKSELTELVDPNLGFGSDSEVRRMIVSVAQLAFQCLQRDKELRPSMDEVLEVLRRIESGKVELEQLEEEGDDGGGGVSESDVHRHRPPLPVPTSPNWDEVGLLKNMTVLPPSPNTVTDKWESKSTTPDISV